MSDGYTWRIFLAYFWIILMVLSGIANVAFAFVFAAFDDWGSVLLHTAAAICAVFAWYAAIGYRDQVEETYG